MTPTPYAALTPDVVLGAVESLGLRTDGRLLALNSYENRVYQVGLEGAAPLVVKFYRPERWSDAAILEEHAFSAELAAEEVPVIAPSTHDGQTLHRFAGFRFAVYPRRGGRAPEFDHAQVLERMGRFIARIHLVGARSVFRHRPTLDASTFGESPLALLLEGDWIPPDLHEAFRSVAAQALEAVCGCYARAGAVSVIRLHGDCHAGNVLWTDAGPHFVDFDDSRMGPAVQDLWMLLSGSHEERTRQLVQVLEGYERFRAFDRRELQLIEALRTLRLLHYAAWLAQRWDDLAFPRAFPWFNTQRYWQDQILALREQVAIMQEPALLVP